jgi:outer membrane protein assembly factor BamE (lipoprotein component of BamABCDE complex)
VHADRRDLVQRGMTRTDVREALGEPDKTFRRTTEWMYRVDLDDEPYWYVRFDDQGLVDDVRAGRSIGGLS